MLCFLLAWPEAEPSGLFQRKVPLSRSIDQSSTVSPSMTLRKIVSPATTGVAAPWLGSSSFQATLSSLLQRTGSPVSALAPVRRGPRHCDQSAAGAGGDARSARARGSGSTGPPKREVEHRTNRGSGPFDRSEGQGVRTRKLPPTRIGKSARGGQHAPRNPKRGEARSAGPRDLVGAVADARLGL